MEYFHIKTQRSIDWVHCTEVAAGNRDFKNQRRNGNENVA